MSRARVLVTGTGAVCGAGDSPADIFAAIDAGRSAIGPLTEWDTAGWPVAIAAAIPDFNPRRYVADRKLHKFIRRTDMLGIHAGSQAIEAAGFAAHRESLPEADRPRYNDRTGCYVGSGGGAYHTQYDFFPLMAQAKGDLKAFGEELGNVVNPMWLLRTLPNNVLCHVGINYQLKGSNACITNHSCGGLLAVIEAAEALKNGECDRAVAIGHDALIEPQMVLYYHGCGLLADDGLKPFDASRRGSVFGEGAGALVLETEASANARAATVLGEVLGGGSACEATGLLAIRDDGDGLVRAIEAALADARVAPADIGLIVAHGNGTPQSDATEAQALVRIFGANMPPVTAFKWATGHTIAAAGILDAVLALQALAAGRVPGIATLTALDPDCAGLAVAATAQAPRGKLALVLSRGFAGTDSALVVASS